MLYGDLDASALDLWLLETASSRALVTFSVKGRLAMAQHVVEAHFWVLDLSEARPLFLIRYK